VRMLRRLCRRRRATSVMVAGGGGGSGGPVVTGSGSGCGCADGEGDRERFDLPPAFWRKSCSASAMRSITSCVYSIPPVTSEGASGLAQTGRRELSTASIASWVFSPTYPSLHCDSSGVTPAARNTTAVRATAASQLALPTRSRIAPMRSSGNPCTARKKGTKKRLC